MAEPRKIFRIEQTPGARIARRAGHAVAPHHGEVAHALDALRALMAAQNAAQAPLENGRATGTRAPHGGNGAIDPDTMSRIALELEAVTTGSTQATHKILAAAEVIDQLANNLAAALKDRSERDCAQDIADAVLRIFEACNFQDLIGQRVGKVMQALTSGETRTATAIDDTELHGPRLDNDRGHLTQREIDALFGD